MGPLRVLAILAAVAALGCDPSYPGEPVGSFDVTGSLQANTCGADALPARNPIGFPVEIRRRDGEAFWRRPERPIVSGVVTEDDGYRFVVGSKVDLIAPDPDFGVAGCSLAQVETVTVAVEAIDPDTGDADGEIDPEDGSVDSGVPAADGGVPVELALEGANAIELTPTPGSDCTAATVTAGGPFLALPCRVDYALVGSERDAF